MTAQACPHDSCEKTFDSTRGLKTHWGRSHDEPAPWKSFTCANCGTEFERPPSQVKTDEPTCSYSCSAQLRDRERNLVTVTCDWCGDIIERYPSHVHDANFCSLSCHGNWMAELPPEESPAYKGGGETRYYGASWEEQREKALEEQDTCTYEGCDRVECQDGRELHVHHIEPARTFDSLEEAHQQENLRVLCAEHHAKVEP